MDIPTLPLSPIAGSLGAVLALPPRAGSLPNVDATLIPSRAASLPNVVVTLPQRAGSLNALPPQRASSYSGMCHLVALESFLL